MQPLETQSIVQIATALSHPRRVLILHTLLTNPEAGTTFGQLAKVVRMCDSSLEHHLRVLQASGVVVRRKKGPTTSYRIETHRMILVLGMTRDTFNQMPNTRNQSQVSTHKPPAPRITPNGAGKENVVRLP